MHWDNTTIGLIGGFGVSLVTVIASVINNLVSKRYEYKKQLYSTVYEIAYKEWEYKATDMIAEGKRRNVPVDIRPYNDYLLFYSRYLKMLEKNKITENDIREFYESHSNLIDLCDVYYAKIDQSKK